MATLKLSGQPGADAIRIIAQMLLINEAHQGLDDIELNRTQDARQYLSELRQQLRQQKSGTD